MKIDDVEDLRNHLVKSIVSVHNKKMEIDELSIISKSCEAVFSSLKLQLTYCSMRNEKPEIPFLQDCNKGKPISIDQQPSAKKLVAKG